MASRDLPDDIADALDVVLGDLRLPPSVTWTFAWTPASALDLFPMLSITIREAGIVEEVGVAVPPYDDVQDMLVTLAGALQDELTETRAAWGQAVPACPGHPHPASADLVDGRAWWICPATRAPIARIGSLDARRS